MRMSSVFVLSSVVALGALSACKPKDAKVEEKVTQSTAMSEEDKAFYSLGALISQSLKTFEMSPKELELVKEGLSDGIGNKTLKAEPDKYRSGLQEIQQTRAAAAGKKEADLGKAFLEKAAGEPGATKTASGIVLKELKAGTGASPRPTDTVKVHYHGTLIDGQVFDSSVQRGEPATFPLNGVIPCWTEGLQKMKVGGKTRLVCPAALAYGDRGSPPAIKPGATLVFDVELLGIEK